MLFLTLILHLIFSHSFCCKVCPRRYSKRLISLPATSDKVPRWLLSSDTVKFFTGILYFSSECNFHIFLSWSSSDILLSSDWILGLALSYAVCIYETRYWARPLPMQFEHMGSIGPPPPPHTHTYIYIYIKQLRWYLGVFGSRLVLLGVLLIKTLPSKCISQIRLDK